MHPLCNAGGPAYLISLSLGFRDHLHGLSWVEGAYLNILFGLRVGMLRSLKFLLIWFRKTLFFLNYHKGGVTVYLRELLRKRTLGVYEGRVGLPVLGLGHQALNLLQKKFGLNFSLFVCH